MSNADQAGQDQIDRQSLAPAIRLEANTRHRASHALSVGSGCRCRCGPASSNRREAVPIAKKAVKKGYSTVIAMGGDGTISAVIRGIAGSDVHMGIIPAGTENDIAVNLGIPENLEDACALIASDQTRDVDLAQISTKKEKKFIFFMVSTVGLNSALYPDVKDIPSWRSFEHQGCPHDFPPCETRSKSISYPGR